MQGAAGKAVAPRRPRGGGSGAGNQLISAGNSQQTRVSAARQDLVDATLVNAPVRGWRCPPLVPRWCWAPLVLAPAGCLLDPGPQPTPHFAGVALEDATLRLSTVTLEHIMIMRRPHRHSCFVGVFRMKVSLLPRAPQPTHSPSRYRNGKARIVSTQAAGLLL